MSVPPRRAPAWTITATLALIYLIVKPPSPDLAAAAYRSDLFGRAGFTLWDNGWYAGHHLLAYSVLAPALGWLIGPRLLTALSMVVAAALFTRLIDGYFPARAARLATLWFALGAGVGLLSSRVPFDLGLALGLGALLVGRSPRGGAARRSLALTLAVLTALASPVAGVFLALAAFVWALTHCPQIWPATLVLTALMPIGLLALAFPEGGTQPFVPSSFYPALLGVLAIGALIPAAWPWTAGPSHQPSRELRTASSRALRTGSLVYAIALTGAYLLPTPVGGNADRLGALLGGPLAACALAGPRPRALIGLAPFLLYWQVNAPVADFLAAASDPGVHASYYAPLLRQLDALGLKRSPQRIEVVATEGHWEARWVAPYVTIARGWERQLDRERNALFYSSQTLTPARYRTWLLNNAVAYVALPDAPLDYSARAEARLLTGIDRLGAPGYLKEIWRSAHWRLYAVLGARPLVGSPATLSALGTDYFVVRAPRPGEYVVRVHFTPYWNLAQGRGCVRRAPGGWTELQIPAAASVRVDVDFSLARVFDHGPRCRAE